MLPRDVASVLPAEISSMAEGGAAAPRIAEWVLSPAGLREQAVRRYLFFLKLAYETFHAVEEGFRLAASASGDSQRLATSALELLYLANHLYIVDSHQVPGVVLECGAFKGFSACCLSHACSLLGRQLVVADSFEGLPEPGAGEPEHYAKADFRGSLEEVRANLATYGRPEVVRLHEGFYDESLRGWEQPVALLWMDVDLYDSARAVLDGVFGSLSPGAALFSHEFQASSVDGGAIVQDREPPGAIGSFLVERGREHSASYLVGCLGMVTLADSVGKGSDLLLAELVPRLRDLDHRARAAVGAIGLRPALRDLVRRRLGL